MGLRSYAYDKTKLIADSFSGHSNLGNLAAL